MKSRLLSIKNLAGCLAVGIFVVALACPGTVRSQVPQGMGAPGNINPRADDRAKQMSNDRMRTAELNAGAEKENQKHIEAAIAHMREDFTRIQVLRNEIAGSLVMGKPLNYSLVSEQTAEINKRASRLNVYMLAKAPESKEQNISAELKKEELVGALVRLCKLIDSFTENPALKNAATVDAKAIDKAREDKARADKDLLMMIKLSENIHKTSEGLKEH